MLVAKGLHEESACARLLGKVHGVHATTCHFCEKEHGPTACAAILGFVDNGDEGLIESACLLQPSPVLPGYTAFEHDIP